jgi:hypothetical protein
MLLILMFRVTLSNFKKEDTEGIDEIEEEKTKNDWQDIPIDDKFDKRVSCKR